ncbi:E3 SUMO-protein ligase SIZ1-like isoform X2 [Alnus glutinosa]|uniref:E3 SUMO-protein ligase SIZ1-like isoform X2 n=1 Tax=Alnus glutinosa TaxID=3517 RepID=UPI002D77A8AD|nr:E3 SUMO-protein ligase SIZ1-like isoform X2 [Alnus glutinosa]
MVFVMQYPLSCSRKIRNMELADLAAKGQSGLDISSHKPEEEFEKSINLDVKICCPCGSSLPTESMIQCVDPGCHVQQHIGCVIIPDKTMEGIPPVPPLFYCEICRIKRADPFWVTVRNLLSPVKLVASSIPTDGTNPIQNVEKTFELTRDDRDLLQNTEYDIQAWCILLNDSVSFRMQWPLYADLQVNGLAVRAVNRPGSQLLGANGRDDGALIALYIGDRINKISLSGCDARVFCFGIRLVKQRTVQQVLDLIPREADGEHFEDGLARVCRCIHGGVAAENEDTDSDVEVIADSITVNLRCPMSGSRMKVAGRFKPCAHMGCFDLDVFVELNQRSRKWQCPICLKNYSLEDIIIDPYFNRIVTMMRHCGEDITEINVKPDGSWSAKTRGEYSDLEKWHFPDGSLYIAKDEATSNLESLRQIKLEDNIEEHGNLEVGIKKNHCGVRFTERQHVVLSYRNQMEENYEKSGLNVITMSSSATGSGKDDENPSINQDCGGHIDISINDGNEIISIPHDSPPAFGILNGSSGLGEDADIIVLSDSEEENDHVHSLSALPRIPDSYVEDPAPNVSVSSCLGLFNGSGSGSGNGSEIELSSWPYSLGPQAGPAFQLFGPDSDVSDAFIDLEHTSVSFLAQMNDKVQASTSIANSGVQVLSSSVCHTNNGIESALVDNPLAFVGEEPSMQNFLPTQPADMLDQSIMEHQPPGSYEDWISLRVGSKGESVHGDFGAHVVAAAPNGLDLINPNGSNEAATDTDMNDEARSNRMNIRKFSGGPFSFPRQPRTVRQRTSFSIESD